MGTVYQTIEVGSLQGGPLVELETVVDTGAADSVLPSGILAELGIFPDEEISCTLADGSTVDWGYGSAMVALTAGNGPARSSSGLTIWNRTCWEQPRWRFSS